MPRYITIPLSVPVKVIISVFFTLLVIFPVLHPGIIATIDTIASPIIPTYFIGIAVNQVLIQKLYLFCFVFIGLLGLNLSIRKIYLIPSLLISLLWVSNPFFVEHLVGARWQLLASISFIPWLVVIWQSRTNPVVRYLLFVILIGISVWHYPRFISFLEVILASYLLATIITIKHNRLSVTQKIIFSLFLIAIISQIFRLVSLYGAGKLIDTITSDQLKLFEVGQGPFYQRFIGIIGYIGFWAERSERLPYNLSQIWYWFIPGCIFALTSFYGWWLMYIKAKKLTIFLCLTYVISLILVLSNYSWIDQNSLLKIYNWAGFVGLRETSKFMGLMLVTQSIGFGYALTYAMDNWQKNQIKLLYIAIVFLIVSYLPFALITYRWGLTPIPIPNDILTASKKINAGNIKTIILPWHRFQVYPFTNNRIIDQLGPSLFIKTEFTDMLEFGDVSTSSLDPWQRKMSDLSQKDIIDSEFTQTLRDRGIDAVMIIKTNDYKKYENWATDNSMNNTYSGTDFSVYQLLI